MAQKNNVFGWQQLPSIPDAVGFAGSYAGVSNGALLVGGGANFPDGIGPWGSTKKTWYDQVYVLEKADGKWREAGKFSRPMGYGVSLTWNDRVICAGGADGTGHYTNAWSWQWKNGTLVTDTFPSLPQTFANGAGAILDDTLYVAGGLSHPNDTVAQNAFWSLDLTLPVEKMVWQKQNPVPGPGRMLSIAGVQDGYLYLFSGVELYYDSVAGNVQRKYLKDAYRFHPQKGWETITDLPHPAAAAPSPAFSTGQSYLLVFGGDDGKLASRVMELKGDHPGFSSTVLAYHTITNTWSAIGEVPQTMQGKIKAPVTTPLVVWDGNVVLPGGEVKPGVRTTHVLQATPQTPTGTFQFFNGSCRNLFCGHSRHQHTHSDPELTQPSDGPIGH